jgi:hypothetical protein
VLARRPSVDPKTGGRRLGLLRALLIPRSRTCAAAAAAVAAALVAVSVATSTPSVGGTPLAHTAAFPSERTAHGVRPPRRKPLPHVRICDRVAGPSGRDDAPGTLRNPFRTVTRLVASLRPGAVGCLLGGTYEERVVLVAGGRPGLPITLRPGPGVRAQILGSLWVKSSADWVTISGLTVNGRKANNAYAVLVQGDHVVLSNVDVTNPKFDGERIDAICVLAGEGFEEDSANTAVDLTIERSRIHNCGDDAHEHGIYLESTRNAHVTDSYLYASPGYGVNMYPDAQGSVIEHNVIDGNSLAGRANVTFSGEAAGDDYAQPHGSDGNVVRFNLITNAVTRYNVDSYYPAGSTSPTDNEVVDNCVWNAPYGNFGGRSGYSQSDNRDADPMYVDRAAANFALQPGSPCAGWGPRPAP